jgi:hypothetical protein
VSRFREPGRVNINTIPDRDISLAVSNSATLAVPNPAMWQAVTNSQGIPSSTPDYNYHLPAYAQQWYDLQASKMAVDPRGPDRMWNTNDDLWPQQKYNLYGIGAPASANPAMRNTLNFASQVAAQFSSTINSTTGLQIATPTIFVNPVRSFCNPFRVPLTSMWNRFKMEPTIGTTSSSAGYAPFLFIDATLLRRADPDVNYGCEPVFAQNITNYYTEQGWYTGWGQNPAVAMGNTTTSPTPTTASLVSAAPNPQQKLDLEITDSFEDPNRNPFFRYYPLQKIGASVTTRSNVYAVWITTGYFQVQKIPLAQLTNSPVQLQYSNPDGYQLVRELGSDSGSATRNRMFFMFDRTIPVGFMRGENINVDKAILLRRTIQ